MRTTRKRTRTDGVLLNIREIVGNPIDHLVAGLSELFSIHSASDRQRSRDKEAVYREKEVNESWKDVESTKVQNQLIRRARASSLAPFVSQRFCSVPSSFSRLLRELFTLNTLQTIVLPGNQDSAGAMKGLTGARGQHVALLLVAAAVPVPGAG